VDERIQDQSDYSSLSNIIEDVLFVYSIPFDILKYMRTIHNYELFTRHSTTTRKNFSCQNMEWLCKWTNNETQLIKSLQTVRNIKTLHCYFFAINVSHHFHKNIYQFSHIYIWTLVLILIF
jgi:hypothetical protein